jgi:Fe2+ or Zn2+ uptake regulation protein
MLEKAQAELNALEREIQLKQDTVNNLKGTLKYLGYVNEIPSEDEGKTLQRRKNKPRKRTTRLTKSKTSLRENIMAVFRANTGGYSARQMYDHLRTQNPKIKIQAIHVCMSALKRNGVVVPINTLGNSTVFELVENLSPDSRQATKSVSRSEPKTPEIQENGDGTPLSTAGRIIKAFKDYPGGYTSKKMTNFLGIKRQTISSYMSTWKKQGILVEISNDEGPKIYELAENIRSSQGEQEPATE